MLQSKSLRDIALQSHKLDELYIKVHLQIFWTKHVKILALIVPRASYNILSTHKL